MKKRIDTDQALT